MDNKNDDFVVEGYKLSVASFQHIATLNVSAILILGTFLKDQFPNPEFSCVIPWLFGMFILSTICSVLTVKINIIMVQNSPDISDLVRGFGATMYIISVLSLVIGLILLSTFVVLNWM
jgi:hypothetical protein